MLSTTVLNQVLILFFIMVVGFYAKKKDFINEMVSKKLSQLLLKVTAPLFVISSFQIDFTQEILNNVMIVFIFGIIAHTGSALLGQLLFMRYKGSTKKIMKFAATYSNCAFMGFPLLESLFGKIGVLFGSVYVATFNIFVWTNGVMLFSNQKRLDKKTVKNALLNPGIVSVVIGIVLFLFSIKLPYPVARSIELLGSMTVPLSMLIIGAHLASSNFKKLLHGLELYYITALRLIVLPVLTHIILKLLGFSGILLSVCTLVVAMPIATTTTIFAEMYDEDALFASRVVAFSTLLSIITIPLIMKLH